ncbi:sulfatase-like hydrolase/transferase [Thermodesulfobacteriota bacterium]
MLYRGGPAYAAAAPAQQPVEATAREALLHPASCSTDRTRTGHVPARHFSAPAVKCLVAALAALALSSCSQDAPRPPAAGKPNVVFIVLDTLRADHLGCYGYQHPTSPNIDAFAAVATRYTRAMASAPWTMPAHASLFTGKNPFEHGGHCFKTEKFGEHNVSPLADEHLTIAEVFQAEEYKTAAFTANWAFMAPWLKLNQGFDEYTIKWTSARVLNKQIFPWIKENAGSNFLLFINYMDTHGLYNIEPRSAVKRLLSEYAIKVQMLFGKGLHKLLGKPGRYQHPRQQMWGDLYSTIMPGTGPLPRAALQQAIQEYDTAITNVDYQLQQLFNLLKKLGLYDNTLIVLISDHGEYLGEHHYITHGKDVYQEALWVPLIIKKPYQENGAVEDTLISFTDIARMVVAELPADAAARHLDHFPDAPGNHEVVAEQYYALPKDYFNPVWGKRFDRIRTVLFDWPYKYIQSSDNNNELYQLEDDPGETRNLIGQQPARARELAERLQAFIAKRGRAATRTEADPLSPEERERLRALGYLD